MPLPAQDFESCASASSATRASGGNIAQCSLPHDAIDLPGLDRDVDLAAPVLPERRDVGMDAELRPRGDRRSAVHPRNRCRSDVGAHPERRGLAATARIVVVSRQEPRRCADPLASNASSSDREAGGRGCAALVAPPPDGNATLRDSALRSDTAVSCGTWLAQRLPAVLLHSPIWRSSCGCILERSRLPARRSLRPATKTIARPT